MEYVVLNQNYVLKPDDGRTLIMASLIGRNLIEGQDDSFTDVIHPIYAMILSFIDGRDVEACAEDAASFLSVSKELVLNFVKTLKDNSNQVILKGKDGISVFPPNTIVSIPKAQISKRYEAQVFEYTKVDLRMKRHLTPSVITLMVNNICATDCIYCYQDKSRKVNCAIPLGRIFELIREAYSLRVNTFDVIGGEFFLYKYWKEVLMELRKYNYNPYLSTKMPLTVSDIQFLVKLKVRDIQISLDSAIEEHLMRSIGVRNGYVEKMISTLRLLDKYGILIKVHTVLTQYNDSIEDMRSLYSVLKELVHLEEWHIVKGEETLYPRTSYSNIEIASIKLNSIIEYLEGLLGEVQWSMLFPQREPQDVKRAEESSELAERDFFNRTFCSGLFSSLYILPDGQVTICEQLYWNKRFIVGNVKDSSIQEIWNSEAATSLYELSQKEIPHDSLCSSCGKFKECRTYRQVCYRDIIRKYGSDKWYYPDVKCPYCK